ncbi:MAG: hypothetical protein ISS66_20785 [Desulfobacteraceae bacterium]|nr:hypothetical protein [Desulfobacteraceae bacterium]MBU0733770.1 hypothetical protein [Pseudomonadota bacterium]MBU1932164.1 hypothetical protein [Patescibacteria group bacterium]
MDRQRLSHYKWLLLAALFLFVWAAYLSTIIGTSGDSRWSLPTALSIIKEFNTDLNEFAEILDIEDKRIECIDGRFRTIFPIGASILATPFVAGIDLTLTKFPFFEEFLRARIPSIDEKVTIVNGYFGFEMLIASWFVALTTVVFFLIARNRLPLSSALLSTFVFAFCTSAWSVAATALWQHGPSMLMLTLTLYLLIRGQSDNRMICLAGLPLAFSYVVRPTNAVSILFLSVFVVVHHRKQAPFYFLLAGVIMSAFFAYNLSIYGALLSPYYTPTRLGSNPAFWEALAGNLVSPARGLFVFSPILFFSIIGLILLFKNKAATPLDYYLICIIVFHWLTVSSFHHWWGGKSFGPRFFCDMLPYLCYFLVRYLEFAPVLHRGHRLILHAGFLLCLAISFAIHLRGASSMAAWGWHETPLYLDHHPERVWDWRDLQFLR